MDRSVDAPDTAAAGMAARPARGLAGLAAVVALGFGSGRMPVGPGTAGSLWGWLTWVVFAHLGWVASAGPAILAVGLVFGVWACGVTAQRMDKDDPSCIVWDEVIAVWLVLWMLPVGADLGTQAMAVGLFRVFDIAKPAPIRRLELAFEGRGLPAIWASGLGIVVDDLMAAAYTLLAMSVLIRLGWAV